MCSNTSISRSFAVILAVAACKSSSPTQANAGSSGMAPLPTAATPAATAATPVAKPTVDVTPRARKLVDAQVAALRGTDPAALAGTFSKDAVVLVDGGHEASEDMLIQTVAQLSPHDEVKSITVDRVVAGGDDGAIWWLAELTVAKHTQEPGEKETDVTDKIRATELATAASGWKVIAAAFGASGTLGQPRGVFPIPDATSAGPLSAMLASPSQLAAALAPASDVVVVSYDDKVATGTDAARALLGTWPAKLTVADAREVRDAKTGFTQANVSWPAPSGIPYRATAQVLALPKPDGSWEVVAVQLLRI